MKKILLILNLLCYVISFRSWTEPQFDAQNLGAFAISIDLFLYIHKLLPEGSTILELGSGSGTAELARYYNMYSIEHDQGWMHLFPSEYIYAPIKHYKGYNWYDVSYLENNLPEAYDLILVDGPPGPIGRYGFIYHMNLFNCNVPIIFDDAQRKDDLKLCQDVAKKLNRKYTLIKCSDGKAFGVIFPS